MKVNVTLEGGDHLSVLTPRGYVEIGVSQNGDLVVSAPVSARPGGTDVTVYDAGHAKVIEAKKTR